MVKIVADSTCDLSKELLERYDIATVPLFIMLDERAYRDGEDISPEEIYRWSDQNRKTPKTSACSVEQAKALFAPILEAGDELICFTISSQMSSTYQNLCLAASELDAANRLFVLDSENLSTGIGLMVLRAADLAREGKSAPEIVAAMEAMRPLVRASFVVDTMTYLYRGGRCTGVSAFVGSTLRLHPRIAVVGGAMKPEKIYRGKTSHAILSYVRDMRPALEKARPERVFITHSGCDAADIAAVRAELEQLNRFEEILVTQAGGVISSHCGPATLGVLFTAGE